jgi:hypothetical protein
VHGAFPFPLVFCGLCVLACFYIPQPVSLLTGVVTGVACSVTCSVFSVQCLVVVVDTRTRTRTTAKFWVRRTQVPSMDISSKFWYISISSISKGPKFHIAGTGKQPCQVFGGHSCPWYSNRDAAAANPGRTPQMIMYSHSDPSQNPSIKSSPRKSRSRAGSHHANRQ